MSEPNLYDLEFPYEGEIWLESDVDADFGLDLGRVSMGTLWHGLTWWSNWWRTAVLDPHHSNVDRFEVFDDD